MHPFTIIILILFWSLFALAVVSLCAYVYIKCMYYKWDKEDRLKQSLANQMENVASSVVESVINAMNGKIDENNS